MRSAEFNTSLPIAFYQVQQRWDILASRHTEGARVRAHAWGAGVWAQEGGEQGRGPMENQHYTECGLQLIVTGDT